MKKICQPTHCHIIHCHTIHESEYIRFFVYGLITIRVHNRGNNIKTSMPIGSLMFYKFQYNVISCLWMRSKTMAWVENGKNWRRITSDRGFPAFPKIEIFILNFRFQKILLWNETSKQRAYMLLSRKLFCSCFSLDSSYYFATVRVTCLGAFPFFFYMFCCVPSTFSNEIYCMGTFNFFYLLFFACELHTKTTLTQKKRRRQKVQLLWIVYFHFIRGAFSFASRVICNDKDVKMPAEIGNAISIELCFVFVSLV